MSKNNMPRIRINGKEIILNSFSVKTNYNFIDIDFSSLQNVYLEIVEDYNKYNLPKDNYITYNDSDIWWLEKYEGLKPEKTEITYMVLLNNLKGQGRLIGNYEQNC